ncbi:hypothetical protein BaRGS_00014799 [Batillaria attramentaria]|uniref:Uncharacterized protein n=1 Tax=Batillaria attramentaria TaxID=370345 RepID=A0ABD0L4G9_9CAEN
MFFTLSTSYSGAFKGGPVPFQVSTTALLTVTDVNSAHLDLQETKRNPAETESGMLGSLHASLTFSTVMEQQDQRFVVGCCTAPFAQVVSVNAFAVDLKETIQVFRAMRTDSFVLLKEASRRKRFQFSGNVLFVSLYAAWLWDVPVEDWSVAL